MHDLDPHLRLVIADDMQCRSSPVKETEKTPNDAETKTALTTFRKADAYHSQYDELFLAV